MKDKKTYQYTKAEKKRLDKTLKYYQEILEGEASRELTEDSVIDGLTIREIAESQNPLNLDNDHLLSVQILKWVLFLVFFILFWVWLAGGMN